MRFANRKETDMRFDVSSIKEDEKAVFGLRTLFQKYGYTLYKMSKFEEYDLYVRNKDFLISSDIITFTDTTGKLMALKPDVTLSIIKNTQDIPDAIQKVCYSENVYRVAKGSGLFTEILQTGLECIGSIGRYEITETLTLAAKSLEMISPSFVLDISYMDILTALLDSCGLTAEAREEIASAIGSKSLSETESLLERYGAGEEERRCISSIVSLYGPIDEVLPRLKDLCINDTVKNAVDEFTALCGLLKSSGYEDRMRIDFSIINDMKYYNGVVFKGYIEGIPASILSGGQYDGMMKLIGRSSGAIGFAVYLDFLEGLSDSAREYDVDTLIIYGDSDDVGRVTELAEKWTGEGSVLVEKAVPEGIKYRRLVRADGKGEGDE